MHLTTSISFCESTASFVMASRGDNPMKPTIRLSQLPEVAAAVERGVMAKGSEFLLFVVAPIGVGGHARNVALRLRINRDTTARVDGPWPFSTPRVGAPVKARVLAVAMPAYAA